MESSPAAIPSAKVDDDPLQERKLLELINTALFREDVVRHNVSGVLGMVMRSWNDSDDIPTPTETPRDPLSRPLVRGEIGVVEMGTSKRLISLESEWTLLERNLHIGDTCKKFVDDPMSGIVLLHETQVKLRHAISNQPTFTEWIDQADLEFASDVNLGDFVVYNDWFGMIEEIFEDALGQLPDNLGRASYPDFIGRHRIGRPPDLTIFPQSPPEFIVDIAPIAICVAWVGINQTLLHLYVQLPREQAETRQRPPKLFYGNSMEQLTVFRRSTDQSPHVFDRMNFRSDELARANGIEYTKHVGPMEVRSMVVTETRTLVTVLFQDGTIETLNTTSLIPYINLDDTDCWPGDFVAWKGDEVQRAAIVQTLDAVERTVLLRWFPSPPHGPPMALVSALDIDPHGSLGPDSHEVFGVQRGDIVFIHEPGSSNGSEPPKVPKIGDLEPWVRDPALGGWREEMISNGMLLVQTRNLASQPIKTKVGSRADLSINWVGEVVHLRASGEIEVRFPNGSIDVVTINRITLLRDFSDDFGDGLWNDDEDSEDEEYNNAPYMFGFNESDVDMEEHTAKGIPSASSIPEPNFEEDERKAWDHLDTAPVPPSTTMPSDAMDVDDRVGGPNGAPVAPDNGLATLTPIPSTSTSVSLPAARNSGEAPWRPFEILPSAPPDHAFLSQTPAGQPTRAFAQRLNKEYKVLSSSLPPNIAVRAYEDRSDLLRCLIIGSANTPYEDAPFVIDWLLPPAFPHEPPQAHFHSWTNGNGRVNPNLYEEGKICLSILNTWAGDKSESWSAARSSLLQALVSIQGLVLVKEPYFCEPAFEKMRGTEEGNLNSRLYSEKVYVLARGFVQHALEHPIPSLSDEIHWIYHTQGKLQKVLNDARTLIKRSREKGDGALEADDQAIERLTLGGILPLSRILEKLETIMDSEAESQRTLLHQ